MADESQVTPEEGSRLRQQNDELRKEIRELKEEKAVRDSGFDHLKPRQRKAVLRELHEDKLELTAENLAKVAEELGYEKPEPSDTGTPNPTNTTTDPDEPMTREQMQRMAMARMAGMSTAMATGAGDMSGEVTKENFEARMKAAKSPDEVMELIQNHGHLVGIMDEADTF